MKKFVLILLIASALLWGIFYFAQSGRRDETKTVGEPETTMTLPEISEDTSLTTIDEELAATEMTDFDQEIQALDESINQL